jgi:hypothetical protein
MDNSSPKPAQHRYRIHGFVLGSEMEFPELARDDGDDESDVTLRFGRVPPRIDNPRQRGACFQARAGEMLLWLDGIARFLVADGRAITIEREVGATDERIRALALASPLAALLLQRGLLALHASAIATPEGAVVFTGPAASGKSTIAAKFAQQGARILADDITALRVDEDGGTFVLPGTPLLRVWPEALKETTPNVAMREAGVAKRLVLSTGESSAPAVRLAAIYVLERGSGTGRGYSPTPLPPKEALVTLLDAIYRPAFVHGLQLNRQVFTQADRLARQVRVVFTSAPTVANIMEDLAR